jgi:hypothetical protein
VTVRRHETTTSKRITGTAEGRPPDNPVSRPSAETKFAPASAQQPVREAAAASNVSPVCDEAGARSQAQRSKAPVAFASQAAPAGRRSRFGSFYGCPHCGGNHIGFSQVKITSRKRLSGCGRVIFLVVKRNYKGGADRLGAA